MQRHNSKHPDTDRENDKTISYGDYIPAKNMENSKINKQNKSISMCVYMDVHKSVSMCLCVYVKYARW